MNQLQRQLKPEAEGIQIVRHHPPIPRVIDRRGAEMDESVMREKTVLRFDGQSMSEIDDVIALEYPLTIVIDGEEFATMVCSPCHLEELVVGFLASEGLIRLPDEIDSIAFDDDRGFAYVGLKRKRPIKKEVYSKRFIGSCCGKSRQFYLQNDAKTAKTVMSRATISTAQCFFLMNEMEKQSLEFRQTGGLHNAALCTPEQLLISRTDIGRHNALDKLYGYALKQKIGIKDKIIVFSGRISSEVLLKAAKIGTGILLSKSAPTTLALELAHDLGITTIGFIRENRMTVYTHPERVIE